MSYKTDELITASPFYFSPADKRRGGVFYEALLEELRFHFDNNESYRLFCEKKGFNPYNFEGELSEIPPIHVSVFKELGRSLVSVDPADIKHTLHSSATSGTPSTVVLDKITAKRQARAMAQVISDYIGKSRLPFMVMDIDPTSEFREQLGARFAAVSGYLNFASKVGFFLKVNDDKKYYFDLDSIRSFLSELGPDESVVMFGFTYVLYAEFVKPLLKENITIPLPKNSKLIHIGGWKKLASENISYDDFNNGVAQIFGLEKNNIIDIYGFTEQMGLNYPTCPCGCKHAPLYSEVLVRDTDSKKVLGAGEKGILEFITPVPHSYPGNIILTDDVGQIEERECPYGRAGTRFKVLGRIKNAEVRGCGDVLSSKLVFLNSKTGEAKGKSEFRTEYFYDMSLLDGLDPKDSLSTIIKTLRLNLTWLSEQPIDALIGIISLVSKRWISSLENLPKEQRIDGITFLSSWCTPEHLTALMSEGLGNRIYVDTFAPISENSVQYKKAVPRGLGCHWLAGNVQVLGMFVLIESILTKNVNLLKVSSRDRGVFASLLNAFKDLSYTTPSGYTISGDDILKSVAVVYFDHSEIELSKIMSTEADFRVAWGGREAVSSVASLPCKYDCENLIMGPKLSFAVVAKEALEDEHKAKKLARKIAIDASVFDQTGCASAHNVFIERSGAVTPEQFSELIAGAMEKAVSQIPPENRTLEQISAIHSVRGLYDFKGTVIGDPNFNWTLIFNPKKELNAPVYSRVLFVHPVDNIMDVVELVNDGIQTIGLAADGERGLKFAEKAAKRGVVRFPVCGRMLNFDSPWDGMYLMDKMIRWVSFGGPAV